MADPHGPAGRRIMRWDRDSVRGTRGTLPEMIRKRPTRGLLVADVPGNTADTMAPLYAMIYNYSPRGVTPDFPSCPSSWFNDAPTKVPRPRGRADLGVAAPAAPRGRRCGHAGVAGGGSCPRRPRWSRGGGPRGRYDDPPTEAAPPLAGAGCRRCPGPTARPSPRGRRRCDTSRPSRSPSCNREARRGRMRRRAPIPAVPDPRGRGTAGRRQHRGCPGVPRGRMKRCGCPRSCPRRGR